MGVKIVLIDLRAQMYFCSPNLFKKGFFFEIISIPLHSVINEAGNRLIRL